MRCFIQLGIIEGCDRNVIRVCARCDARDESLNQQTSEACVAIWEESSGVIPVAFNGGFTDQVKARQTVF